jgi:hypothetical protein
MTNPTPSEFDAKLDGILGHIEIRTCGNPYCDAKIYTLKEAKQTIRAAVREVVPKKHKERPYKFFSGGYESELAAYVDGFNNAIAEVLAGIGVKDNE